MSVFKTIKAEYPIVDFQQWSTSGQLEITPKFQRRPVWRPKAKSHLIDTILRGMTVPPIYLRITQSADKKKVVREVVDGQQRVRSVLEYMEDTYKLSGTHDHAPWAGKKFSQLSSELQDTIRTFTFSTETFQGISDGQILEVFCRVNTNGVQLNKQELRNGNYFGLFKQTAYALAHKYIEFWKKRKIFGDLQIARMLEVELTSELLIVMHGGMQDKKTSIESYYKEMDDSYPEQNRDADRFQEVLGVISETFTEEDLVANEFRRPPFFYTLFCVIYHHAYGLPGIQRASKKKKLRADDRQSLLEATAELSEILANAKDKTSGVKTEQKYVKFVEACLRQTDNIGPRKARFDTLYSEAFA